MFYIKLNNNIIEESHLSMMVLKQRYPTISFSTNTPVELGYTPVTETAPPASDEYNQVVEVDPIDVGGGVWEQQWSVTEKPLAECRVIAKNKVAEARYAKEIQGVDVAGIPIGTDRQDQATIAGILAAFSNNFITSVNFKTQNGFVFYDQTQMLAVGQAVAVHVQSCFDSEKNIGAQIDAAPDVATLRTINLTAI